MDNLISDLLKLTKLQSTDIADKDFSRINLKTISAEIKVACKPESLKNKNNITILSDDDIFIKGSYEEIYSAFINLVSNAIAYSGKNIPIEINYLSNNKNEVEFSVKDYGAGIPAESVDRLTERFYRIDKGRSREHGGTGLGLSIVKHIMNRHNGKLKIESAINEGSKFTCVFPKT
jgi:two-component system phosphate regulon sensor histidine kinase PhoR